MYPSGRRNITVIPHLGKIREREQRLTEVLREEFSIDSSTHEDELQVRPTGRGDMLLHTPIHAALTSLPFHPHTHTNLFGSRSRMIMVRKSETMFLSWTSSRIT